MQTKSKHSLPVIHLPDATKSGILDVKKDIDREIKKAIGEKIRGIRRTRRGFLSAEVVAHKLGISRVALTQLENGQNNVSAVTLWKLATILGCDNFQDFFPPIPTGFELSQADIENIKKKDKNASEWAETLFKK
ncbi:MAG: helix-turn-helix transcriptional regulator [Candidatus Magasanikbacteria bacterium]|jgi:transcriptional regulator with XRE-family HTH domain